MRFFVVVRPFPWQQEAAVREMNLDDWFEPRKMHSLLWRADSLGVAEARGRNEISNLSGLLGGKGHAH